MTRRIMEFELSRDQIQSVYIFSVHKGLNHHIIQAQHMQPTLLVHQSSICKEDN